MINHAEVFIVRRRKALWQAFVLFLGAFYAKIALIHLTYDPKVYVRLPKPQEAAPYGSETIIVTQDGFKDLEENSVDYTVCAEDYDGITQRLEDLADAYRQRWMQLSSSEVELFLKEVVELLAPRMLPFIAHKYKNYQFLHYGDVVSSDFYPLQNAKVWMASTTLQEYDDGSKMLYSCVQYPRKLTRISSPEDAICAIAHEMVHRARMHPQRFFWHGSYEDKVITDVQAADFLQDELHVDFDQVCSNLSQHQESEADYCSFIALRSPVFIKSVIIFNVNEELERTSEHSSNTHPSSLYRIRMCIEYWIQFLMDRDAIDYATACQQVSVEYRELIDQHNMHDKLRNIVLQLSPDSRDFGNSL